MKADVRWFIAFPNRQICQHQRVNQEAEFAQVVTDHFIQLFQRQGINLIGVLPHTGNGNRWMDRVINYANIQRNLHGLIMAHCRSYSRMGGRTCGVIWTRLRQRINTHKSAQLSNEWKGGMFKWNFGGYDIKIVIWKTYKAMGPISGPGILCFQSYIA